MSQYFQVGGGLGHYFARPRAHHFANQRMFDFLRELSQRWGRVHPNHPWGLGDISMDGGGSPPVHKTHTYGACVDIFIINTSPRANSLAAAQVFEEKRINYASKGKYDLERTTALVDLLLELRGNWPFVQFIYDDKRVRPEYRRSQWAASTAVTAATAVLSPMSLHGTGLGPILAPPSPELMQESKIISVDHTGHADHIHIQLT